MADNRNYIDPEYIYFDNAASTINDERVIETFVNSTRDFFANPSSIHQEGQRGARKLALAHDRMRELFHAPDHHIIVTGGATEANNLAIKGYCLRYRNRGNHIITSMVEHASVLEVIKQLVNEFGFTATYLKPDKYGVISTEQVKNAITKDTILASIMAVNNETGAINPVEEIADLLKSYPKIVFHSDAVQACGKVSLNYSKIDMVTITGHKMHGLIGCGALLKRKKIELLPLLSGGGQELGFRSGTNDLAHTLALVTTLEIATKEKEAHFNIVKPLYLKLMEYLNSHPDLYELNTYDERNPYIVNFSTLTKKASVVVEALSNLNIMVSSISACHSSKEKSSHVIKAMKDDDKLASNTIRISFDYINTVEQVDKLTDALDSIMKGIR